MGQGASTDSNFFRNFNLPGSFSPIADFGLLRAAADGCERMGFRYRVGNLLSSDVFYGEAGLDGSLAWSKMGVLAVEMEAAALYMNAARAKKKALAICTISDVLTSQAEVSPEERQNAFTDMMRLALEVAEA